MKRFLLGALGLVSLTASATTSQLGRTADVNWPDLGDPAGASQVNTIQASVAELSDNDVSRYVEYSAIANGATNTITHNLGAPFADYEVYIYSGNHPSLTIIEDPENLAAPWTIAAGASPNTQIDITAPASGGPHTFAVLIKQGKRVTDGTIVQSSTVIDRGEIRFEEASGAGNEYVGIKAPASVASNIVFSLPATDGSPNQVLKTDGSLNLDWATALTDPMTTRGDLIIRNTSNITDRLGVGAANTVLKSDGTDPSWGTIVNASVDAAANIDGSKIAAATVSVPGVVSISAQTFNGLKTFDDGLDSNVEVGLRETTATSVTMTGNVSLAGTDEINHWFDPNGATRDVTLANTASKGKRFVVCNDAAASTVFLVLIKSSDGSLVRRIWPTTCGTMVAMQDTPTAETHWQNIGIVTSPQYDFSPVFTNTGSITWTRRQGTWKRVGSVMVIKGYGSVTSGDGFGGSETQETIPGGYSIATTSTYYPGITFSTTGTLPAAHQCSAFFNTATTWKWSCPEYRDALADLDWGVSSGKNDGVTFHLEIPISGWEENGDVN